MNNKGKVNKEYWMPFLLTLLVIVLDQASKAFIVTNWPAPGTLVKDVFNNGFLLVFHVRNKAIAFSLGENIPQEFRSVLFIAVPILVLACLTVYYFRSSEFTRLQRWAVAGIIGGGLGNIIDRIFRTGGVVDFISVKFYGIFGMERWPTFNVADSSVVICCFLLLFSMLKPQGRPETAARRDAHR